MVISEPPSFCPVDTLNLGTLRVPREIEEGDIPVTGFRSEHILRHVGILGSSGSGKTVMAKAILEECAIADIPSIIIDVRGDLASLMAMRGRT